MERNYREFEWFVEGIVTFTFKLYYHGEFHIEPVYTITNHIITLPLSFTLSLHIFIHFSTFHIPFSTFHILFPSSIFERFFERFFKRFFLDSFFQRFFLTFLTVFPRFYIPFTLEMTLIKITCFFNTLLPTIYIIIYHYIYPHNNIISQHKCQFPTWSS